MATPFFRRVLGQYTKWNTAHPFATQAISAGVVASIGDLVMQKIEGQGYDLMRTGRMIVYRTFFFAPTYLTFLKFAEKVVKLPPARAVAGKVILEQLIWAPPSLMMFYSVMGMLEGKSVEQVKERVVALMPSTMQYNWGFWIPVQCITFSMVPLQYRILWVSFIQVGWNAWLSGVNNDFAVKQDAGASGDVNPAKLHTQ